MMIYSHYDSIDFAYLRKQAAFELISDVLEKAVADVEEYKAGRSPYLRNNFYSDKVVETKIVDALEYDVPMEKLSEDCRMMIRSKGFLQMKRKAILNLS